MNAKAGRKPASMPESKEVDISDAVIEQEVAANNQLAAMRLQDERMPACLPRNWAMCCQQTAPTPT